MEWAKLILSNLTGIAAIIALVISLVKYVKETIKERNWPQVVKMVSDYMAVAEEKFDNGADRKQWVMAMVQVSAEAVKYNINMTEIGQLIDDLCKMSKVVNGDKAVGKRSPQSEGRLVRCSIVR